MRTRLFLLLVAAGAAGCGARGLAPVSGRVTLDGSPAAGVHVSFQPVGGEGQKNPGVGSYAITDSDGRFTLKTVDKDAAGAVVGKHRVEITTRGVEADDQTDMRPKGRPKAVIPLRYGQSSDLTFDVPAGGTSTADFPLKSK